MIGDGIVTFTTSGRGNVIFGDSNGNIWVYNRHWESTLVPGKAFHHFLLGFNHDLLSNIDIIEISIDKLCSLDEQLKQIN